MGGGPRDPFLGDVDGDGMQDVLALNTGLALSTDSNTVSVLLNSGSLAAVPSRPATTDELRARGGPNPAYGSYRLSVWQARAQDLTVRIHDVTGRTVAELFRGDAAAGAHTFTWTPGGPGPRGAHAGVYFYEVQTPTQARTGSFVLTR